MRILLYILIFIVSLFLLIVIIPLEYEFKAKVDEKVSVSANLMLFKFLKVIVSYKDKETFYQVKVNRLSIINKNSKKTNKTIKKSTKSTKRANKKRAKEDLKTKKSNFNIMDYVEREFLMDSINYIKNIINIIKPKSIKIYGIYGFEDPSLTGMACGIIPVVTKLIPTREINLEPVFDDEIIDINCEIYGKISLIIVAIKTLKFVLKKNNRRKIFRKTKKAETY